MNEIKIINVNELTGELRQSAQKITGFEYDMKQRMKLIAIELAKVNKEKLYEHGNFKSTADFAEKVLGYKHSAVSKMIKVADTFLLGDADNMKCWTMTALQELLPLSAEKVNELIENGTLSPDMTKDEVRKVVNANRPAKSKKTSDKAENCEELIDNDGNVITENGTEVITEINWESKYKELQKTCIAIYDKLIEKGGCTDILQFMCDNINFY